LEALLWWPGLPVFEIYVAASVVLALLTSSPIISYQVMKSIAPALATRRRMLYSLVGCAIMLLAAGVLFGNFLLVHYYLPSSLPFSDPASFYFILFRAIGVGAVAFTIPVYVYALIRFRLLRTK